MSIHPKAEPTTHLCGGDNAPDYMTKEEEKKSFDRIMKKLLKENQMKD